MSALAIELDEYSTTMATDAIKNNQWEKAEGFVNDGLKESPQSQNLLGLKAKIDAHKRVDQQAYEKKKAQEVAELQNRPKEDPVKKLQRIYCDCQELHKRSQDEIEKQNKAAAYSGMINKNILYNMGQRIRVADEVADHIKRTTNFNIPTCSRNEDLIAGSQCLIYGNEINIR
jgi:hypothetical protein